MAIGFLRLAGALWVGLSRVKAETNEGGAFGSRWVAPCVRIVLVRFVVAMPVLLFRASTRKRLAVRRLLQTW